MTPQDCDGGDWDLEEPMNSRIESEGSKRRCPSSNALDTCALV
jgi:hypothetical protein